MTGRNCPNCGSPYELERYSCPYCGTLYIDLTMIDFDNQVPFFLKIKTNGVVLTQRVLPQTVTFDSYQDNTYCYGGRDNNKLISFINNSQLETNIQFIAVPFNIKNHKQILCTTKQEKTNE